MRKAVPHIGKLKSKARDEEYDGPPPKKKTKLKRASIQEITQGF